MSSAKITIIHDSFGQASALKKDWGFSAYLAFEGQRILFDTGNNARTFADNSSALGLDLGSLDYAVISHRHGYYDGNPPETIRHGSPWPDANFVWVKEITEVSQDVFLIPVVSDVPGTREMREISVGLRTPRGMILVAGCSHPGIEKILEAARPIADRVLCIIGGLHLVLTKEPEVRRVVHALRDDWHVERIAPGHCTGEPAFAAIREAFGERCLLAGLGESIEL